MKTFVALIAVLVGYIVTLSVGILVTFIGIAFPFNYVRDNEPVDFWDVAGMVCYTVLIVAATLLIRWAFT